MKTAYPILAAMLVMATALPASAACFADYKARQDNPLQLHYGVARISGACSKDAAAQELRGRLASQGWRLLNVLSVFDESGLNSRKAAAGAYFLRF